MSTAEILAKVAKKELSPEAAAKLLAAAEPQKGLYCKVSEKGALSVYGLQRMPVTLYVEQWERLLGFAPQLQEFMAANSAKFNRKEKAA